MKTRSISSLCLSVFSIIPAMGVAVESQPDTVLSVTDSRSVVITESAKGLTVKVSGRADDPEFVSVYNHPYREGAVVKSRQTSFTTPIGVEWVANSWTGDRWDCISGGLGFGFVNAVTASGTGLPSQMGKSFEAQWLYVLGVKYRFGHYSSMTFGFGLDWRFFRTSLSDQAFRPKSPEGGAIVVGSYPDGVVPQGSCVNVFSLMLPLMYQQTLPVSVPGGRLGVFAGPIASFNTHASVNTKWLLSDGTRIDESCSKIGHRMFTIDFMAGVRFCGFANLYVRYSPQTVLKAPSPQFRSLSTGVILTF